MTKEKENFKELTEAFWQRSMEEKKLTLLQMQKKAKSFEDWFIILNGANNFSVDYHIKDRNDSPDFKAVLDSARERAVEELTVLARTRSECLIVYDLNPRNAEAMKKALALSFSFEQAEEAWEGIFLLNKAKTMALIRMAELALTFEHWLKIWQVTNRRYFLNDKEEETVKGINKKALIKLFEKAEDPTLWALAEI